MMRFLPFFLLGAILGSAFKVLSVCTSFVSSKLVVAFIDALYFSLSSCFFFFVLYAYNNAVFRTYYLVLFLLGFYLPYAAFKIAKKV